jgi:hypothetical protein
MTAQLQLFWYEFMWAMHRGLTSFQLGLAALVPRWLVAACVIRCVAHATTGKHSATNPGEIRAMTALKRWDEPNV